MTILLFVVAAEVAAVTLPAVVTSDFANEKDNDDEGDNWNLLELDKVRRRRRRLTAVHLVD